MSAITVATAAQVISATAAPTPPAAVAQLINATPPPTPPATAAQVIVAVAS